MTRSWAAAELSIPRANLYQVTQQAIDVFLASKQPNGEIGGIGYWQTANGYTAVALHDLWSGTKNNQATVTDALTAVHNGRMYYINEFNDDSLWWGLCLLAAYRAYGHNEQYLGRAHKIQNHVAKCVMHEGKVMVNGQDMGGACLWTTKPGEQDLNSITTGLFAEISADLCNRDKSLVADTSAGQSQAKHGFMSKLSDKFGGSKAPQKSKMAYDNYSANALSWIQRSRMNQNYIIQDTIKVRDRKSVDWEFTYLNGQAIGASVAFSQCDATNAGKYLDLAIKLAMAAMTNGNWVEPDGCLTEANAYGPKNKQPHENDDAVGFKSILVRNLAKLYDRLGPQHETSRIIRGFVNTQFNCLQERNRNENGQYGPWWGGPFALPTSHAQLAVLDVMAAVHLVNNQDSIM